MRYKTLAISGLCVFMYVSGLLVRNIYLSQKLGNEISPPKVVDSVPIFRTFVKESIHKRGTENTYTLLKNTYENYKENIHNYIHIFGEELFNTDRLAGLKVCDDAFLFACYHGFFSRAFVVDGISLVLPIADACGKLNANEKQQCFHGVGHGLLLFLGENRLIEALNTCLTYTKLSPGMNGCVGGVVMEYNFGSPSENIRLIPKKHADRSEYYPCSELSNSLSPSCYFENMQWILIKNSNNFTEVLGYCTELDMENRDYCFLGLGNFSIPIDYDIEKEKKRCREIPIRRDEENCLLGAAWSYVAGKNDKRIAGRLCEGLNTIKNIRCPKE